MGKTITIGKGIESQLNSLQAVRLVADAIDEGEDTNGTTGFVEKIKLQYTPPEAGVFIIGWSYEHSRSVGNQSVQSAVELDDTTELSSDTHRISSANDYINVSGWSKQVLDANQHDIDIDFRKVAGGGDAKIRRARLMIYKIS